MENCGMATTDKCNDRQASGASNLVEVIYTNRNIYIYTEILPLRHNKNSSRYHGIIFLRCSKSNGSIQQLIVNGSVQCIIQKNALRFHMMRKTGIAKFIQGQQKTCMIIVMN